MKKLKKNTEALNMFLIFFAILILTLVFEPFFETKIGFTNAVLFCIIAYCGLIISNLVVMIILW
ncbi:hypothetical protein KKC00_03075 [Patescibacteria group bacterium]|nr:hypothetical protein [Patescibacteria group bacterium]